MQRNNPCLIVNKEVDNATNSTFRNPQCIIHKVDNWFQGLIRTCEILMRVSRQCYRDEVAVVRYRSAVYTKFHAINLSKLAMRLEVAQFDLASYVRGIIDMIQPLLGVEAEVIGSEG
jgi:hypothetical protein